MSTSKVANAADLLVPRFVANLNAYAQARGIDVQVVAEPYDNDPEVRLWSKWRAPLERFLALECFTPFQRAGLRYKSELSAMRSKTTKMEVGVPSSESMRCVDRGHPILVGVMNIDAKDAFWEIDSGPVPVEIIERDGVEVSTFEKWTAHHGSMEALVALGIPPKRFPPTTARSGKSHRDWFGEEKNWATRRQLDSTFVHWLESPAAFSERQEENADRERRYAAEAARSAALSLAPQASSQPKTRLRLVVNNA